MFFMDDMVPPSNVVRGMGMEIFHSFAVQYIVKPALHTLCILAHVSVECLLEVELLVICSGNSTYAVNICISMR